MGYHIQGLCLLVTCVPVVVTGVTTYFYVSNGHHPLTHIVPLWEAVSIRPESRFFAIGMNMVGWIMACLFLLYDRYLTLKGVISQKRIYRWILNISGTLAALSVLGFSAFTFSDSEILNSILVAVFWVSICVYMLLMDIIRNLPKTQPDTIYKNGLIIILWATSSVIKFIAKVPGIALSIGAILEYLAFALTFFKLGLTWWFSQFGKISLHMVKKSE